MSDLYKDSFYITKKEKKKLVAEADRLGLKTSETLRRIIDAYFEKQEVVHGYKKRTSI